MRMSGRGIAASFFSSTGLFFLSKGYESGTESGFGSDTAIVPFCLAAIPFGIALCIYCCCRNSTTAIPVPPVAPIPAPPVAATIPVPLTPFVLFPNDVAILMPEASAA